MMNKLTKSKMKRNVFLFSITIISLGSMAFGCMNPDSSLVDQDEATAVVTENSGSGGPTLFLNQTDEVFVYDVNVRFARSITKKNLHNAKTVADILMYETIDVADSYDSTFIHLLDDNKMTDVFAVGVGDMLSSEQIELLATVDYARNIRLRVDYKVAGFLNHNSFTPYYSVVPEKETVYSGGMKPLLSYLKENSKEQISIAKKDNIQPGKIYFTVTDKGAISNVRLNSSCGYTSIDKVMMELIKNATEKWEPAQNSKGENVAQQLVFSYGNMGC